MENTRKSKKKFYKQKKEQIQALTDDMTGFLITCNQNRERNAIKDAYIILNQYVDQLYPTEIEKCLQAQQEEPKLQKKLKYGSNDEILDDDEDNKIQIDGTGPKENKDYPEEKKDIDIVQELNKEIAMNQSDKKVFYSLETNCKGVVFIKVNPIFKEVVDVKKIANIMMKDIHEKDKQLARHCLRMIPIEYASKASLQTFREIIINMLKKKFIEDKPKKWMLHFKCRNNNQFSLKPFLEIIIEYIGKSHKVDFKNPDYTIFVEISNHIMCVSILKKLLKYNRYSLHSEKSQENNVNKTNNMNTNRANNLAELQKNPSEELKKEVVSVQNWEFEEKTDATIQKTENNFNDNKNAGDSNDGDDFSLIQKSIQ